MTRQELNQMSDEELYNLGFKPRVNPYKVDGVDLRFETDIKYENPLDQLLIPKGACKLCTLKCGDCGIRCTYFKYHYNKDKVTLTSEGYVMSEKYIQQLQKVDRDKFINNFLNKQMYEGNTI